MSEPLCTVEDFLADVDSDSDSDSIGCDNNNGGDGDGDGDGYGSGIVMLGEAAHATSTDARSMSAKVDVPRRTMPLLVSTQVRVIGDGQAFTADIDNHAQNVEVKGNNNKVQQVAQQQSVRRAELRGSNWTHKEEKEVLVQVEHVQTPPTRQSQATCTTDSRSDSETTNIKYEWDQMAMHRALAGRTVNQIKMKWKPTKLQRQQQSQVTGGLNCKAHQPGSFSSTMRFLSDSADKTEVTSASAPGGAPRQKSAQPPAQQAEVVHPRLDMVAQKKRERGANANTNCNWTREEEQTLLQLQTQHHNGDTTTYNDWNNFAKHPTLRMGGRTALNIEEKWRGITRKGVNLHYLTKHAQYYDRHSNIKRRKGVMLVASKYDGEEEAATVKKSCNGDYNGAGTAVCDEMGDHLHPIVLDSTCTEIALMLPRTHILQTNKINASDPTCESGRRVNVSTASNAAPHNTAVSTVIVDADAAKRAAPASAAEQVMLQSQGPPNGHQRQHHPEQGFQHELSDSQAVSPNTPLVTTNVPATQLLLPHEHQQPTHLGVHSKELAGEAVAVEALPCLVPVSIIASTNTGQGRPPRQFPVPLMPMRIAPAPFDQTPPATRVGVHVHSKVAGEVAVEAPPCLAPVSIFAGTANAGEGRPCWQFPVPIMPRPIAPAPFLDQTCTPFATRVNKVNNDSTLIVSRPTATAINEHNRKIQIRAVSVRAVRNDNTLKKVNKKPRGNERGKDKKQRAPRSCVRCYKFGGRDGQTTKAHTAYSCQGRLSNFGGQNGCQYFTESGEVK